MSSCEYSADALAGYSTVSRESIRSPSGGAAPSASSASIFSNVWLRLYQRSRLPRRPTSGTTQNGSSGSKS